MSKDLNFHQTFVDDDDVKPPSPRATGLVFAVVALIVAAIWHDTVVVLWVAGAIGAALVAISLAVPHWLAPLNWFWFRFGLVLHRIVNPIVMAAIFGFVFVPFGLVMRLWHDPLRRRRADANGTYWIDRASEQTGVGGMDRQF